MGCRIHVSPVYQVTYDNGHFSNQKEAINRLLFENSEDISFEGDCIDYAERIEVPRADIAYLISKIVANRDNFSEWLKNHDIAETPDRFIKILCGWIAESDPRNDYVVLTWF